MMFQRVKQPISRTRHYVLAVAGLVLLGCFYTFLSNQAHKANSYNTTVPNWTQLWNGLVDVCTPQESDLRSIFGVEEATPGDQQPLSTFFDKVRKTNIYKDVTATYSRLFIGMSLAALLSVFVGLMMGCYESVASVFEWPLSLFARIPGTAMLALFFGMAITGEPLFTTMIVFGCTPMLIQAVYLSAKYDLKKEEIDKAYTLGASHFEVIFNIMLPKMLPKILENIRLQIGPAMVCLIAAEMMIGEVGIGYQIRQMQKKTYMAVVYDYLFILGVTGLLVDYGMLTLRRRLSPWFSRFK